MDEKEYAEHFSEIMPSDSDRKLLLDILQNEKKWIVPKVGARSPLESIGETRKAAI